MASDYHNYVSIGILCCPLCGNRKLKLVGTVGQLGKTGWEMPDVHGNMSQFEEMTEDGKFEPNSTVISFQCDCTEDPLCLMFMQSEHEASEIEVEYSFSDTTKLRPIFDIIVKPDSA